jgi:hypothetical protein
MYTYVCKFTCMLYAYVTPFFNLTKSISLKKKRHDFLTLVLALSIINKNTYKQVKMFLWQRKDNQFILGAKMGAITSRQTHVMEHGGTK